MPPYLQSQTRNCPPKRGNFIHYKGQNIGSQQIAEELGVRALLIGRLNQQGDNLLVNVELIDTEVNSVLWGEQYNQKITELLAVQEKIAMEISDNLRWQLSGEEQSQMTKKHTQNPEAYRSYLEGRYWWNKRTKEGFEKAIGFFNEAIEQDPAYALAYTGLADTYNLLPGYGWRTPDEAFPLGKSAARKALQIDEALGEAHASLGLVAMAYDMDWSLAETEYKRAIELNPNYATAHQWYGLYWTALGHLAEGEAEFRKALELDPLSLIINRGLGRNLYFQRRYDQAIEQMQKTLEIDPNFAPAHHWLTFAFWSAGRHEDAIIHAEIYASLESRMSKLPVLWRQVVSGRRLDALRTLEDWQEIPPGLKARYYAMLGEKEQAIEEWNKSLDESAIDIFLNVWPFADPLRDDPRFQDLLRRMNLEP